MCFYVGRHDVFSRNQDLALELRRTQHHMTAFSLSVPDGEDGNALFSPLEQIKRLQQALAASAAAAVTWKGYCCVLPRLFCGAEYTELLHSLQ